MTAETRYRLTITPLMAEAMGCRLPHPITVDSRTQLTPVDERVKRVVRFLAEVEWACIAYKDAYRTSELDPVAVSVSYQKWCTACAKAITLQIEVDIFIEQT